MFDSLKSIKDRVDQAKQASSRGQSTGESAFLKLKDGESVKIRFAQEFDSAGPHYDEHWGKLMVVDEHTNPSNFQLRAACSLDEQGKCWACEQTSLPDIGYKWRAKLRLYANVIVETPEGPKVKILASGFGDQAIGSFLLEFAEEFGSTMNKTYKLTRNGTGLDTTYILFPVGDVAAKNMQVKGLEPIDASKFVKFLPYAEQAAYFGGEKDDNSGASSWLS